MRVQCVYCLGWFHSWLRECPCQCGHPEVIAFKAGDDAPLMGYECIHCGCRLRVHRPTGAFVTHPDHRPVYRPEED